MNVVAILISDTCSVDASLQYKLTIHVYTQYDGERGVCERCEACEQFPMPDELTKCDAHTYIHTPGQRGDTSARRWQWLVAPRGFDGDVLDWQTVSHSIQAARPRQPRDARRIGWSECLLYMPRPAFLQFLTSQATYGARCGVFPPGRSPLAHPWPALLKRAFFNFTTFGLVTLTADLWS